MEKFQNYLKLPLVKNQKYPAVSGWNKDDYNTTEIDNKIYDVGIITGVRNNLLVVDVDIKDDGVKEMNEYIKINGDINTFTVKTPSGGVHYYFKYTNSNTDTQYLIDEYLTNKSKFRKKGLDIRTNGGLIKAPPSTGYEILKNLEIVEIPETLVLWLLENVELYEKDVKTITLNNNKLIKGIYKYNIEEEQLKYIVSLLDKSYYTLSVQ